MEFAYVLDSEKRYYGIVSTDTLREALERGSTKINDAFITEAQAVQVTESLQDILARRCLAHLAHPGG